MELQGMNRIKSICNIYDKLIDEESKKLFSARINYVFDRNINKLIDAMWKASSNKEYTNENLVKYFLSHEKTKVIIFGAGYEGRKCNQELKKFNINVSFYCDNDKNKVGTYIDNILCLTVDEVCQTVCDFIDWCDGKYEKIYCFEPNRYNKRNVEIKLKDMQNIEIIEAGTWNKEGRLSFNYDGPASRINEVNSTDSIIVTSIDNIVRNELVTYIKMDVEGAELESIIGAQNTIKQNKPDLAICVYHKWLDFIDLPMKLLELVPEYKFAIRHYSNNTTETVLYAFID